VCAVIGNPVEHSLSPLLHNRAFQAAGLNFIYVAFHVEDVGACMAGVRAMRGFRGMSVTIPHKMAIMAHLDEIAPMARHVGSVNTVVNESGRLIGSTTDGPGTLRAFAEAGVALEGRRVLFVGSGGAVRAVAFAVALDARPEYMTVIGRTPSRVETLVRDVRAGTDADVKSARLEADLAEAMESHDIIIHGTPVGMYPNAIAETPIPESLLRPDHVVFDMVYRPLKTRLLTEAEAVGCTTILGAEMLVNQATLQFEAWTNVPAPVEVMRSALYEALQ